MAKSVVERTPSLLVDPPAASQPQVGGAGGLLSVRRRVVTLAWPAVVEMMLATSVALINTYIVGHLGSVALAAVGLSGQITMLGTVLFGALGVGSTALVARFIGADEPDEASRITQQSMLMAVFLGLLTAVSLFVAAPALLNLLGADADVLGVGVGYLRLLSIGVILLPVLMTGTAIMRGAGDTRTPMLIMLCVNLVDASLGWSLAHGVGPLPELGVSGPGISASLGRSLGALLVVVLLVRGREGVRLSFETGSLLRPDWGRIKRILNIGVPSGAEQMLMRVAQVMLTGIITALGTQIYASHQVAIQILSLSFMPGWGFAVASTTLVGQELGAGRPDRARQSNYESLRLALIVMCGMGLLLFVFPESLVRIFSDEPEVVSSGVEALRVAAAIQPFLAFSFVFSGSLRGAGDTRSTLIILGLSMWLVRLPVSWLTSGPLGWGLLGAWAGIGADFAARSLVLGWRFRSGKWQQIEV